MRSRSSEECRQNQKSCQCCHTDRKSLAEATQSRVSLHISRLLLADSSAESPAGAGWGAGARGASGRLPRAPVAAQGPRPRLRQLRQAGTASERVTDHQRSPFPAFRFVLARTSGAQYIRPLSSRTAQRTNAGPAQPVTRSSGRSARARRQTRETS